jgi:hypothetical protein
MSVMLMPNTFAISEHTTSSLILYHSTPVVGEFLFSATSNLTRTTGVGATGLHFEDVPGRMGDGTTLAGETSTEVRTVE